MLLCNEKITKAQLSDLRGTCFDYAYKNNNAMLRERYVFMFTGKPGLTCVECNTNGSFIIGTEASLTQAMHHLSSC